MYLLFLFFASFVQGFSGFGFNLVALPLLGLSMPLSYAVPFLTLVSTYANVLQLFQIRKKPDLKIILPLLISGLLFVPVGMYILLVVPDKILKICVGIAIFFLAILLSRGFRFKKGSRFIQCIIGGMLSGILKGATSIGGPPAVILLSNFDLDKESHKANLISYFFLVGLLALPAYFKANLFTLPMFYDSLKGLLVTLLGLLLGHVIFYKVKDESFKKITYIIIMCAGLLTLWSVF